MLFIKKIISLLFIWFYAYSQSVFSHLLLDDVHKSTIIVSQDHIHESWEIHEHINEEIQPCSDFDCQITCSNMKKTKLVLLQSNNNKYKSDCNYNKHHLLILELLTHLSLEYLVDYVAAQQTPISPEELMPRVWPIVRVI